MTDPVLPPLLPVLPEMVLAVAGLVLLMLGVFRQGTAAATAGLVGWLSLLVLAITAALVWQTAPASTFGGMFVTDAFTRFAKLLTLGGAAATLAMSLSWLDREGEARFEFPVLVLFAVLGMMMMISAGNLMSLYMGLELQSLALYVLAAFQRGNVKASEAGLKYFVLGSVASGLYLYGASLVYGFAGTTDFAALATVLGDGEGHIGAMIGLVFVLAALAFKVSAVPFHMWTPDVYEGAPTPVTAFFSVAPKVAALTLLVRVAMGPFLGMVGDWQQIIVLIAAASMIWGAFAAIPQNNIKRLMAYSSIGHVGYALMGLAAASPEGVRGLLVYLTIYVVMNVGVFAVILSLRQHGRLVENIPDMAGMARTNPMLAAAMGILMFSMAGIPPLAGFFAKFHVFLAAIHAGQVTLAIIGVLSSVVAAYYYLRIIKVMYFDQPVDGFDRTLDKPTAAVLAVSSLLVLFFSVVPARLTTPADAAAAPIVGASTVGELAPAAAEATGDASGDGH
ncbi:NADH-quinone oxidoreductase subunit NuoN [Roseospirillum parvum]|uniref:NADH-quinone oxidoreductase subunit N n=1 Tax=Roseospirillum parvum TaxID=83401 RepID=A0A1G8B509_9PROT|nr:NADH-quinone oxidoreductase subunit NuoN [Roseospirillum parvum]SDH28277.1 NADH-quinone oxidoreductase subunit N [Roseospirillum parvum]